MISNSQKMLQKKGGRLRSRVCREVRRASGAAMAVAPDGPRSLELDTSDSEGRSFGKEQTVTEIDSDNAGVG